MQNKRIVTSRVHTLHVIKSFLFVCSQAFSAFVPIALVKPKMSSPVTLQRCSMPLLGCFLFMVVEAGKQ